MSPGRQHDVGGRAAAGGGVGERAAAAGGGVGGDGGGGGPAGASTAGWRLPVLLWAVGLTGAALLALAGSALAAGPEHVDRALLAVALATLVADTTSVELRVRRHVESYTWAELTLVVGLALLTPEQLVLTSLGLALGHVLNRRSASKVVFNTAAHAVGLVLALAVTRLVGPLTWDDPVRSALALTGAVAAFAWWNGASVSAAIAFSQGLPFRAVYRRGARLRLLVAGGNLATGLAVLGLWYAHPPSLLALPLLLTGLYAAYRGALRVVQERTAWRHLETTSREISRLDEREIAHVTVPRTALLMDADEVELWLLAAPPAPAVPAGRATAEVYAGGASGVLSVRTELGAAVVDQQVQAPLVQPGAGERDTTVVVPLLGRGRLIGQLRVRFLARVKPTQWELQLLQSFAHTVGSHLSNARLYDEMRQQASRNETAALHDALTGLPNRALLQRRVQEVIARGGAALGGAALGGAAGGGADDEASFALLLLDLDHFKEVNDTLGHAAGDTLLCQVAGRLRAGVRAEDTVCRLGGDEFAVLLTDAATAERTAARLVDVLGEPLEVDGLRLAVGGSVGVACYPGDAGSFEELLRRADVAMYQAKVARGSYRRYSSERDESTVERLSLVAELRTALAAGQVRVHFQPQHDLRTGRPVGAEALARWEHPTRGLLPPCHFLPALEGSSLVREFTLQVLDVAVAECASWRRRGADLTVAVNLSARSLDDGGLAEDVAGVLARHGLPADRLVLEITETAIMGNIEAVAEHTAWLRDLGVVLSIDDFGTGHSSLTILQRIAVQELKIDRSFVKNILDSEGDETITRATVQLARGLGLRTVAEGVEEAAVLERLIGLQCDVGQGHHWAPAVPAAEVGVLLGVPPAVLAADAVTAAGAAPLGPPGPRRLVLPA